RAECDRRSPWFPAASSLLLSARAHTRRFFFQAEDGIRGLIVTGVQTCALPISGRRHPPLANPGRRQARQSDADHPTKVGGYPAEIGRASCRERVDSSGGGVAIKKKESGLSAFAAAVLVVFEICAYIPSRRCSVC